MQTRHFRRQAKLYSVVIVRILLTVTSSAKKRKLSLLMKLPLVTKIPIITTVSLAHLSSKVLCLHSAILYDYEAGTTNNTQVLLTYLPEY